MSIRLDYATKVWCVVLDCTRQVVYMSVSLQQCREKYPKATFKMDDDVGFKFA